MNARRLIPIILFIVGAIAIVVVGLVFFLNRGGEDDSNTEVAAVGEDGAPLPEGIATPLPDQPLEPVGTVGPTVRVVVSIQTIPRGWRLTANELTYDERLRSDVKPNVITDMEDAIGLYVRSDIFQGQTLTEHMLVSDITLNGVQNYGPSSLIPPGWVAMSVPMHRVSNVGYALTAGDSIDVMMTFHIYELNEEFQTAFGTDFNIEIGEGLYQTVEDFGRFVVREDGTMVHVRRSTVPQDNLIINEWEGRIVTVVLQNAKVINVGPWKPATPPATPVPTLDADGPTPTPGGSAPPTPWPEAPWVMLLALPPQQQLYIKYALEHGADMDFALRPANDGQIYDVQNVDISYLLEQFNIEIPPDYDAIIPRVIATPSR